MTIALKTQTIQTRAACAIYLVFMSLGPLQGLRCYASVGVSMPNSGYRVARDWIIPTSLYSPNAPAGISLPALIFPILKDPCAAKSAVSLRELNRTTPMLPLHLAGLDAITCANE